jgi:signal transduction histidine kinase
VAQVLERRLQRNATIEPERLATALTNITLSTVQMANLVDQLLDYARLQMDRPLDLDRQPTDLVALARQTVSSYAGTSERHELRFETQATAITGQWDRARLERVLQNLISNAVKYSPQGGPIVVQVWTATEDGRPWGFLSVADQGLGVPAADLPQLFERFHRGANVAGRIGGTGIGLATVRQIVEQHGGQVGVSSIEGQGSTFIVRLPLDGQPTTPEPPAPPSPLEGAAERETPPASRPARPPELRPAWHGAGA